MVDKQASVTGPVLDSLDQQGISRKDFLKFCGALAAAMALPISTGKVFAEALLKARRPSVIWLSFQGCTGCTESILRSHSPSIEGLIFNTLSLDFQETLMASAGHAVEAALRKAVEENKGKFLLVIEGSVSTGLNGAYSCIGGQSNLALLQEVEPHAAAVVTVGTCASFGGIPNANPNPTGAVPVSQVVKDKPIVNIPGCPPIPIVMTGVLAHYLTFGTIPELDGLGRPRTFYAETIHDRCFRRPFYDQGKFAKAFDDEGARKGWCLFELGCKGPVTYNSCATVKWNASTSFPIEAGHPCLGCSEPKFWDAGGFYRTLSQPTDGLKTIAAAVGVGAAVGVAATMANRRKKGAAKAAHQKTELEDLKR